MPKSEGCVGNQVNGLTRRAQAREATFGYQRCRACNFWVPAVFKIDDGHFDSLHKILPNCQMRCINNMSPTSLCQKPSAFAVESFKGAEAS